MSYNVQLQYEYRAYPSPALGLATPPCYRVSFLRENYAGEVIPLLPESGPFVPSWGNSDGRFEPIFSGKATFDLVCQDYWEAVLLYAKHDREIQVIVEVDETNTGDEYHVDWMGWVLATDLKEDYAPKPYPIQITATDGLEGLKSRPLLDESGARLSGMVTMSTVIRTALGRTDSPALVTTAVNLFETADVAAGQTSGGLVIRDRDPFNRTKQNTASLVKDSEAISSYDALVKELSVFGCRVCMARGDWQVIRVDEAAGGWDKWSGDDNAVMTRRYARTGFTTGPLVNSTEAKDFNVYVSPTDTHRVIGDAYTTLSSIKPGVRVEQAFGAYLNKLENGNLAQIDNTGLPIGFYRKNISDPNKAKRFGIGTDADPYRLRIYGSDYEGFVDNETQGVDIRYHWDDADPNMEPIIQRNKKITRTLKGRFKLHNARGAKIVIRESALRFGSPWWILADGGTWIRNPKAKERVGILVLHDVLANNVDTPKPGWCDFSITLPPVDFDPEYGAGINDLTIMFGKPYTLETYDSQGHVLGPVTTPEPYIEYADIEVIEEDVSIKMDGMQRTIVQKNKTAETVLDMTVGDVPSTANAADRTNTLFKLQDGNVPTTKWYRPNANILAVNPTGDDVGKPLIDWNVESRARQDMNTAMRIECTLTGRLINGPLSILRFFDIGEEDENGTFQPYPFQIVRLESNTRDFLHKLTAVRMMTGLNVPTGAGYTDTHEWKSGDDTILIENDPITGLPVGPTLTEVVPPGVSIKRVIAPFLKISLTALPTRAGFTMLEPGSVGMTAIVRNSGFAVGDPLRSVFREQPPFTI